jgi:VCBS repeat-containing protein
VSEGIINLDKAFTLVMNWDSNAAPLTKQDTYTVVKNSVTSLNASQGLLSNDSDSDGDTLIASFAPEYLQGYITINRDGSFKYTAPKDFTGVDDFYYKVTDGKGKTSFAKVTMTIVDSVSNNNPTAINDNYSLNQDTTLTGNVLSNDSDVDGDSLTASVINNVTQGSLTLNSNGSFSYTPNANYFGTDSFTYQVSDGKGGFANATVTLTINQSVPTIPSIKLGNQYYAVEKYDTLQDSGSASVNASGELTLTGNAWKYIDLTGIGGVNITSDSLLAFDFKSDVAAEIQGVGFDNDRYMNNSANRAFQLTGIQRWGIQQFDTYSIGSGWKHYEIPIGAFFTGSFNYFTFFNDDDRANPTGISEFRNLEIL